MGITPLTRTEKKATIGQIISDPSVRTTVPALLTWISNSMGRGPLGTVISSLNAPAFRALDPAVKAAQKTWPFKVANSQFYHLLEYLKNANKKAVDVLGEPPKIQNFLEAAAYQTKLKQHIPQLDKLIDANFKACSALSKIHTMVIYVEDNGKKNSSFDLAFWAGIKKSHCLNFLYYSHYYNNSLNGLLTHRNNWGKWCAAPLRFRPKDTVPPKKRICS